MTFTIAKNLPTLLTYYYIYIYHFISLLQGLSMQVVRFRFDGQPINENDTPTSLEMEEGDTIEVYQQQTGGNKTTDPSRRY